MKNNINIENVEHFHYYGCGNKCKGCKCNNTPKEIVAPSGQQVNVVNVVVEIASLAGIVFLKAVEYTAIGTNWWVRKELVPTAKLCYTALRIKLADREEKKQLLIEYKDEFKL